MSKFVAIATAAAAVLVVAAVVGLNQLPRQGSIGGPGPTVTPIPTAQRTSTAPSSPAPSPVSMGFGELALEGGRYSAVFRGHRYTFSGPAGWLFNLKFDALVVVKDSESEPLTGMFIAGPIADVPTDACQGLTAIPGNTVDDYANALAATVGFDTEGPADVTLAGHQGQRVVMTVPEDVDFGACENGEYHGVNGKYAYDPGTVDDVRVLDVAGSRQILMTSYAPGTSAETLEGLDQVLSSLEIEPIDP